MENPCPFCKIVSGDIPAKKVHESDTIIAFHDIRPIAPVHVIIIPKKHIKSIANLTDEDEKLMGHMILMAKKIAEDLNISEKGYKLLFRVGVDGGQEVAHVHLHLIGGAKLTEEIYPA